MDYYLGVIVENQLDFKCLFVIFDKLFYCKLKVKLFYLEDYEFLVNVFVDFFIDKIIVICEELYLCRGGFVELLVEVLYDGFKFECFK